MKTAWISPQESLGEIKVSGRSLLFPEEAELDLHSNLIARVNLLEGCNIANPFLVNSLQSEDGQEFQLAQTVSLILKALTFVLRSPEGLSCSWESGLMVANCCAAHSLLKAESAFATETDTVPFHWIISSYFDLDHGFGLA